MFQDVQALGSPLSEEHMENASQDTAESVVLCAGLNLQCTQFEIKILSPL